MNLLLVTGNPSKAEQIGGVFVGSGMKVLTLRDAGIDGEPVESGTTLEENALIKARFGSDGCARQMWTMADDTGLFIGALGGAPGVLSARWAGPHATTEEIMQHTLRSMKDIEDRTAYFKTVVAVVSPKGLTFFFEGLIRGRLLHVPRVPAQPKMPYSPIFVPEGTEKVWAEMSVEEENKISHRGQAFRKVREFLEKQK